MTRRAGDLGRFYDPSMLILASLAGGPKHGYGMMQDIKEFSGVSLEPGTLYGALTRLEERGLIEALAAEDRRRPYRLTFVGATLLSGELQHLERVAAVGLQRLTETGV